MWIMILLMTVSVNDPRFNYEYKLRDDNGNVRTFKTVVECVDEMKKQEAEIKAKTNELFTLQCKPAGK